MFVLSACSVYLCRMSANGAAVIAHAVICTAHGRNLRSWAGRDRSDTVRLTARAWACPVRRGKTYGRRARAETEIKEFTGPNRTRRATSDEPHDGVCNCKQ